MAGKLKFNPLLSSGLQFDNEGSSGGGITEVNGQTGPIVNLDTDDIPEGVTNEYFTDQRAQDAVVVQTITDGDTDHAPSSDVVFDALETKQSILTPTLNIDRTYWFWTDFTDDDRGTLTASSNAGGGSGQGVVSSSTGVNSTENCIGVVDQVTGTGTTARASLTSAGNLRLGSQSLIFQDRSALSALSDGTNTYTSYSGFIDNTGAGDMTDGCYFRYTHSVNSGRWEAVVAAAGVRTPADTGISPSATVNQILEIRSNQDGTSVTFYIDGTLVATHTTGLPGTSDLFVYGSKIEKSAGSTSRIFSHDYYLFEALRTTSR